MTAHPLSVSSQNLRLSSASSQPVPVSSQPAPVFCLLALRRLVTEGFNPAYGARPLRRAIMRLIEDCLAERILTGEIKVSLSSLCSCVLVSKLSIYLLKALRWLDQVCCFCI